MLSVALASLLAAASSKPAVLVLDLDVATGIEAGQAEVLDEIVANAVGRHVELSVISAAELQRMVELEGQKQVMGCDTTSCLGELAGAMGARYVVSGRAGVLGGLVVVSLNLFDSMKAKVIARQEARADSLDAAARLLDARVETLLLGIDGVVPLDVATSPVNLTLLLGSGTAAVGVVSLAAGATWLALAMRDLGNPAATREQKDDAVDAVPIAGTIVGAGAIALVGGGIAAYLGLGGEL